MTSIPLTGIPFLDMVINLFNFLRLLAGIGAVVFMALIVMGVSGFFASPYSRWGLFVGEYITGANRPWGRNLMGIWAIGLLICLFVWFVFSWPDSQTPPRFP